MSETPEKSAKAGKPAQAGQPAATDKANSAAKPAKPAAKPKPEDKPFAAFINEDLLPALKQSLSERNQDPISLELVEGERPVVGGNCWMLGGLAV